ncbi:MAG: tetratricopeptide repeat protein [Nitrospiria bacterium]
MVFSVIIALMFLGVFAILAFPLFRNPGIALVVGDEAVIDEERVNTDIERQTLLSTLSVLEVDHSQGKVSLVDYESLKLGYEHRLAAVLDRLDAMSSKAQVAPKRKGGTSRTPRQIPWIVIGIMAFLVAGGSSGIYELVHYKFDRDATSGGGAPAQAMPPIDPVKMVARLEKRLKENPDDLEGQVMIGRSYVALERWEDAKKAWRKVLELDPRHYTAHYQMGELLLRTSALSDVAQAEEALGHIDKALIVTPQDAGILWLRGWSLVALGRTSEADEAWTEAFQYIPQGTEESETVKQALRNLREGKFPSP